MTTNHTIPAASEIAKAIDRLLAAGETAVLVTLVEAPARIGAKLLIDETGLLVGSLGDESLDRAVTSAARDLLETRDEARTFAIAELAPQLSEWTAARILCERIESEPRVVICGAGHVGAALAQLASFIGYSATLIDDRAEFVSRERVPDERISVLATTSWSNAVREAIGNGRGVSVAVVTRGHNEDEECMRAIIGTNANYIGLIGSKRRTNIVLERLRQMGASDEQLRRVHAPIGLDIGAITPEEVALAILAEIVAIRRQGKGGSLSGWRRK